MNNKQKQTINKSIFKEKKTIKGELLKALEEKTPLNYNSLAKRVGISVHRVKKYCKNHNIDLVNYSANSVEQPIKKTEQKKTNKPKNKMIILEPSNNKINLFSDESYKIDLLQE